MKRHFSGDDDDDDDDSVPSPRRARVGGFSEIADPNQELEAMLAANNAPGGGALVAPPAPGFTGVIGAPDFWQGSGKGKSKGGAAGERATPPKLDFFTGEPRVQTTPMDFSKLSQNQPTSKVNVQKELVEHLMTPEHRKMLTEETGATVEWVPEEARVDLMGSAEQIKRAQRLLARVMMHSRWGCNADKVKRILKPKKIESVLCRLSPMNTLRPVEKTLSSSSPVLTVGKDKQNDAIIQDPLISRQHCVLELDEERGAVYLLDTSTNGTFLNSIRLPSKQVGKVLLSHGDEVLLKDPAGGEAEFGYIVNLNVLQEQAEVKLEAPRRLLSPEEQSSIMRDFA